MRRQLLQLGVPPPVIYEQSLQPSRRPQERPNGAGFTGGNRHGSSPSARSGSGSPTSLFATGRFSNLPEAMRAFLRSKVYDTSEPWTRPRLVATARSGMCDVVLGAPDWGCARWGESLLNRTRATYSAPSRSIATIVSAAVVLANLETQPTRPPMQAEANRVQNADVPEVATRAELVHGGITHAEDPRDLGDGQ